LIEGKEVRPSRIERGNEGSVSLRLYCPEQEKAGEAELCVENPGGNKTSIQIFISDDPEIIAMYNEREKKVRSWG